MRTVFSRIHASVPTVLTLSVIALSGLVMFELLSAAN